MAGPITSSGAATSTPTVASWAEQPQTPPNYIFPFMSLTYFSVANISEFQYLMYRPLYWFGNGTTPGLNENLSLADQPAYTNNNSTLTINLKDYKWSNGETVTTQDVMFFLNMLHAEKANWAAYAPGGASIPDSIKSVTIDSPTQMTLQLTTSVNTFWYTYNQLGQITPFPMAWDTTSTGGAPGIRRVLLGRIRHGRRRLHRGLHLPVQPGGVRPGQPEGGQQRAADLRHQPALAGGRRAVAPDQL